MKCTITKHLQLYNDGINFFCSKRKLKRTPRRIPITKLGYPEAERL